MSRRRKLNLKGRKLLKMTDSETSKRKVAHKKKSRMAFYLKKGLSLDDAQLLAKVTNSELGFMRSDPDFEDFVQRCSVTYEKEMLEYIEESASLGTWQAAAWVLERKFPDKYGKKDMIKHEYTIKMQSFQKVVLEILNKESPELRYRVINALKTADTKKMLENTKDTEKGHVYDAEFMEM